MKIYMIDEDELALLKRVEDFLYHCDMHRPTTDETRDHANLLNHVRTGIERYNLLDETSSTKSEAKRKATE